jgi:SRSO17 transposase
VVIMDAEAFAQVADSFATFHARFAPRFGRAEARRRSEQYVRGLLVQQTDRRNAENLAEALEDASPRSLQRFLTEAPWNDAMVLAELHRFVAERLPADDGAYVLDDTGFAKQGNKSVGVARQYSGTLGKVGNCQVGVFLGYASARGAALVDRALYLPERWTTDRERCAAAGVPDDVTFQTKPELGLALLRRARARGALTSRWLTADEAYGQVPAFRDALDGDGWWYVLEVPCTTRVFAAPARAAVPARTGRGRPPTRTRLLDGEPGPSTVQVLAAAVTGWETLTVAEGAQGPRSYQFWAQRVWECRDDVPGRESWLVLRRNLDGSELKYYLSNAPADTPLATLGRVGALRWTVETGFQQYKGEAGLDEYEVRSWRSWHHHTALALLAGAFLLQVQQDWGEKEPRSNAAASQSAAAGAAAATDLDRRRLADVGDRHATPQRPRQTRPRPAPRQAA